MGSSYDDSRRAADEPAGFVHGDTGDGAGGGDRIPGRYRDALQRQLLQKSDRRGWRERMALPPGAGGAGCQPAVISGAGPHALLERTVEISVLTTLLKRHGALHPPAVQADRPRASRPAGMPGVPQGSPSGPPHGAPDAGTDFERFLACLAAGDGEGALALLVAMRRELGPLDDRMEAFLVAASRGLGSAWEDDRLSFAEVSLGLVTLQRLLHEFASPPRSAPLAGRRMLLLPVPGESHGFGLRLLGVRLAQAGWDCQCESGLPEEALLRRVAAEPYDVVALSVQDPARIAHAPALIARLRLASLRPDPLVLLGGAPFVDAPAEALAAGADLPALPFPDLCEALERRLSPGGR